jgi:hypothetical protein
MTLGARVTVTIIHRHRGTQGWFRSAPIFAMVLAVILILWGFGLEGRGHNSAGTRQRIAARIVRDGQSLPIRQIKDTRL